MTDQLMELGQETFSAPPSAASLSSAEHSLPSLATWSGNPEAEFTHVAPEGTYTF